MGSWHSAVLLLISYHNLLGGVLSRQVASLSPCVLTSVPTVVDFLAYFRMLMVSPSVILEGLPKINMHSACQQRSQLSSIGVVCLCHTLAHDEHGVLVTR